VGFVDDDEAEPGVGQEQRRARADHYLRFTTGNRPPRTAAFSGLERGMPDDRRRAEALLETPQEGFRQRDFRQQDQRLPLVPEALRDGLEIDLGLAGSGYPVEQEGSEASTLHRGGEAFGNFALVGSQFGLRVVGGGRRIGPVAIHDDWLQHALVDEPAQHAFADAGYSRQL